MTVCKYTYLCVEQNEHDVVMCNYSYEGPLQNSQLYATDYH